MTITELRIYSTKNGKKPFIKWIDKLHDNVTKAYIKNKVLRLALGQGDIKFVGGGIFELRIHYGAGYRVYFTRHEKPVILLLTGGSKRTQQKDIKKARLFWQDFLERHHEKT
ncbi:MAG: type II toxin-antitoxin system RelE/ParE family toxin [Gammaproteobacteria bacterium]|jgi:putative addiction module killer protein